MKTMTLEEFQQALLAQGVPSHEHFAFKCPQCHTIQSATDLILAGAGDTFEQVEKYLGFSCVGRWKGETFTLGRFGLGCDWTLGGLFQLHELEVITPDDKSHPRFELATPEEAQALYKRRLPR